MDYSTFVIVLLAATMHALWNLGAKKTKLNRLCLMWIAHFYIALFCAPFIAYKVMSSGLGSDTISFLVLTGVFHALYIILLGWAYRIGDISFVYPVSRGLSIVGTSLMASVFGVDILSVYGVIGVITIATGIMIVGNSSNNHHESKALLAAVCLGVATSFYSIIDKIAVKHISSWLYCGLSFSSTFVFLSGYIMIYKPSLIKVATREYSKGGALLGGMMFSTYGLILYAFQNAPAAYVVALRETAIAIATILGVVVLKERGSIRKFTGIAVLMIGVLMIKMI